MAYDWVKSKFKASDLNGKSVEFRVPLEQGGFLQGEGKFEAVQDSRGWIRAAVIHSQMTRQGVSARKIFIPAEAVESIVKNPPDSNFEFTFHAI